MKKFLFPMERVLEYKTHIQKNEKEVLSGMRKNHELLCAERDELVALRNACLTKYNEKCLTGISIKEINTFLVYVEDLHNQIKAQVKKISESEAQIAGQIQKVIFASKEKKSMNILKDNKLGLYKAQERKEEELLIDEFVSNAGSAGTG